MNGASQKIYYFFLLENHHLMLCCMYHFCQPMSNRHRPVPYNRVHQRLRRTSTIPCGSFLCHISLWLSKSITQTPYIHHQCFWSYVAQCTACHLTSSLSCIFRSMSFILHFSLGCQSLVVQVYLHHVYVGCQFQFTPFSLAGNSKSTSK